MVIKCSKCGAENYDRHMHCFNCGGQTQEYCPVCHCLHPVTAAFCPGSGKNIAEYKLEVERKKEVEKEFDKIFPTTHRKACLIARWKAFIVSLICWEAVLAMICLAIGRILSSDEVINSSVSIFLAVIILIFTVASTGVSYERKRDELLVEYFGEKIPGEKN